MIDRKRFYDRVRPMFGGKLTPSQVHGMEATLNEWERLGYLDLRWLAYMFATIFHETARRMVPIAEFGRGKGRKYGVPAGPWGLVYYGRGLVQLTWFVNYARMGELLGLPLVRQPDLLLIPEISLRVMFEGMTTGVSLRGDFTGHSLEQYFSNIVEDWQGARRIINRMDKAALIAGYGRKFRAALGTD